MNIRLVLLFPLFEIELADFSGYGFGDEFVFGILIKNGKDQEYIQFDLAFLGPILQRVKGRAKKSGKEAILTGMFEGTGCSFLLYEKIYKRPNERLVICPFRDGIKHNKFLRTTLTIKDVCNKFCIPRWTAHGNECGVEVKVATGKICSIKIS